MSATAMWWGTLGVGVVVTGVVAILLAAIVHRARDIRGTLEEVWVVGPGIARNTSHVDVIRRIDLVAEDVVAAAREIEENVGRIQRHAEGCSGCPRCVTGWDAAG